jgi:hypothetical protein
MHCPVIMLDTVHACQLVADDAVNVVPIKRTCVRMFVCKCFIPNLSLLIVIVASPLLYIRSRSNPLLRFQDLSSQGSDLYLGVVPMLEASFGT